MAKAKVPAESVTETGTMILSPSSYHPPTLAPARDSLPTEWPTNFNLATAAGKAGLLNSGNPPVWRPADGGTYRMRAVNYVVCPGETTDPETGEVSLYTMTVFVDAKGENVKLSSDWAPRRLHAMLALYSEKEWAKGIEIECYTGQSRRGGRMYASFRIIPATSDDAA